MAVGLEHLTQDRDQIVDSILKIAQKEQANGNTSITKEKLDNLTSFVLEQKRKKFLRQNYIDSGSSSVESSLTLLRPLPIPQFSPLFSKFDLTHLKQQERKNYISRTKASSQQNQLNLQKDLLKKHRRAPKKKITFKVVERVVIEVLESIANVLDNLHLFSRLPMFPQRLLRLLKQTNKLWVVILVFLIRKTVSQLLNVIRKEQKVAQELEIVRQNSSKLFMETDDGSRESGDVLPLFKRYEKVLKDLKFDKMMLYLELVGNFLDLAFNLIELFGILLPEWFMSGLNAASMCMTIYRMNKDDEYVDDDITEDLL